MTKREAIKYITKLDLFSNFKLERLARGNNSEAFLIESQRKKYTLRVRREDSKHENRLQQHYINLKFLEAEGIDFAPKAAYFDETNNTMIATYLPGKSIIDEKLSEKQFAELARHIITVNKLSYLKYKKFCRQLGFKLIPLDTPARNIKIYATSRFDKVKKYCPEDKIINWIKPRLKENINFSKSINWGPRHIGFNHGDLTGANILENKGKLIIIDWERSRFVYSREYGLSYMCLHYNYFYENIDKLIKYLAKYAKRGELSLRQATYYSMKSIKVNDVIWAAQAYSELKRKNQRGWKKYQTMTYRRMREYEELFEK